MAHAYSLLRWQLFACKTQHAFVMSWSHTSTIGCFGSTQSRDSGDQDRSSGEVLLGNEITSQDCAAHHWHKNIYYNAYRNVFTMC